MGWELPFSYLHQGIDSYWVRYSYIHAFNPMSSMIIPRGYHSVAITFTLDSRRNLNLWYLVSHTSPFPPNCGVLEHVNVLHPPTYIPAPAVALSFALCILSTILVTLWKGIIIKSERTLGATLNSQPYTWYLAHTHFIQSMVSKIV